MPFEVIETSFDPYFLQGNRFTIKLKRRCLNHLSKEPYLKKHSRLALEANTQTVVLTKYIEFVGRYPIPIPSDSSRLPLPPRELIV